MAASLGWKVTGMATTTTTPKATTGTGKRGRYGSQWQRRETPMRFTDRDADVLDAIAANRVLTRDLLLWLFPPDEAAQPEHIETKTGERRGTNLDRRLTLLYRNGYLDRIRTVYGGAFLYALSDRGAQLLKADPARAERLGDKITGDDWQEKNRVLSTLFLSHALMVARIRCALVAAARAAGWSLDRFDAEANARPRRDRRRATDPLTVVIKAGDKEYRLRPDAVCVLGNDRGNTLDFFLEADRSTMHHDKMAKKFRAYERMHRADMHREHYRLGQKYRVLTITKSVARRDELLNLVAGDRVRFTDADGMRRLFYFASETDFLDHPENILADIWRVGHRPTEPAAIIPQPLKRR
jgi:hypothetical protein